jgi:hypothetical protein
MIECLKSLFPRGSFWEIEKDSAIDRLLTAISTELTALEGQIDGLSDYESDPDYLAEMARRLAVPATAVPLCLGPKASLTFERWYAILSAYGYQEVEIVDYSRDPDPFSQAGGEVSFTLKNIKTKYFRAGMLVGEPLATWTEPKLEALVNQIKPVSMIPTFIYPIPQEE